MGLRVAALAGLLVFAGCLGPIAVGGPDETPDGHEPTPVTASPATPTTAANPWGTDRVTVGVVNTAGSWRNVTGSVAHALEYWERHDAAYGRYEVDFVLQQNGADSDVVVRYVENLATCGSENGDYGAGFAPRISAEHPPDPPEYVCVRAGFTEASTERILEHEFGHLLGIEHGEPPSELMRVDAEYQQVPRPTEAVRAAAASRSNLSVYVDRSTVFARRNLVAKRQLDHVFEYYGNGSDGSLAPVDVTRTEDRDAADVAISFPTQSPCERSRPGSCAKLIDRADGRPQLDVAITTTHEDTFGWHAGFWLGLALGADRHDELPAPFRNASFDDRHGDWWAADS